MVVSRKKNVIPSSSVDPLTRQLTQPYTRLCVFLRNICDYLHEHRIHTKWLLSVFI